MSGSDFYQARGLDEIHRLTGYLVAPYNLQGAMIDACLDLSWRWQRILLDQLVLEIPPLQHVIVAEDIIEKFLPT
ncbi:MAG: hypothetical protein R3C11_13020 [Planctomycetaceae bacterium]